MPSPRPPRPACARVRPARAPRRGPRAGTAYASAGGSWHPRRLLDLGHGALSGVEEGLLYLGPAAEELDREQLGRGRELGGELMQDRADDRAVALLRPDRLRVGRPQPVDEGLRLSLVAALARDRDRGLDQDRLLRDQV